MKKILFYTICLIISGLQAQDVTIPWSSSYKLSWNDFKGPIDENSEAVATTASGITFGYSLKMKGQSVEGFTTTVKTYFYPEKSWYKPKQVDENVLAHEQFHFNITELFARKFRKKIAELKVSNTIKESLNTLHKRINKDLAAMQKRYDAETNYSINKALQNKWQLFIAEELNRLKPYSH